MPDFSDPQVWWFLTRASAIVAWVLMTMAVLWGILLKTRILRGADNPEWLKVTHRYISGLALAMIATHMGSLLLDEYISFTVSDLLIPFSTEFEPFALALGIVAFWLVILVQVTALAAKWLPERLWKGIHLSSYLSLALVAIHSGMVGTDVGQPWYTALSLILITTATLAGVVRVVIAGRAKPSRQPQKLAPATGATAPQPTRNTFRARVVEREEVGHSLVHLTLEPVDPSIALEWDAGSHLTLHLGNGLERQYSLAGDPASSHTLVLGIQNTRGPGGGSTWIHENLHPGSEIECDYPRNAFPLKPAHRYQFIASGVGITPIASMLHQVPAHRDWSLIYLGRSRKEMLFSKELTRLWGDRVTVWASDEKGSRADLPSMIDPFADVYVCGAASVVDSVQDYVAPKRFHVERFEPVERTSTSTIERFEVIASRSGITVSVGGEDTVLGELERAGVAVNASCRRGTCGSCELAVLAGTPEHLDSVMSDDDKDEMGVFYPCVSRSKTPQLTIDA